MRGNIYDGEMLKLACVTARQSGKKKQLKWRHWVTSVTLAVCTIFCT